MPGPFADTPDTRADTLCARLGCLLWHEMYGQPDPRRQPLIRRTIHQLATHRESWDEAGADIIRVAAAAIRQERRVHHEA